MPELPEVETIRSQLEKHLPLEITRAEYSNVSDSIIKEKKFSPKGKTIKSIHRKGKLLWMGLGDDQFLFSHLGMSGSWHISQEPINEKHCHLHLCCQKKEEPAYLGFVDPRRFGKIHLTNKKGAELLISKLGVDVSTPEFTAEYLIDVTHRCKTQMIKPLLLEQKYFSGIGNYMASEICARAQIHPARPVRDINLSDATRLVTACASVIEGSIKTNGLTFAGGYSDTEGNRGEGVQNLVVFHQEYCQMCKRSIVKKIVLKGRGTYFCPDCQPR